jgi:transcriptional regulator with PAS, ATPase and Fis domain
MANRLNKPIGQILLENDYLTKEELNQGLEKHKALGKLLGQVLIELGFVKEEDVLSAYSLQQGIPYFRLDRIDIPNSLLSRVPISAALKLKFLPIKEEEGRLTMAMATPQDSHLIDDLETFLDCKVEPVLSSEKEIINIIKSYQESLVNTCPDGLSLSEDTAAEPLKEIELFHGIVCKSKKMKELYDIAIKVASSEVTVLLQGESGTGKEVMARFIHQNSLRKDKPFLKVSCAALPETLLESELFGHEKGSYTGATTRRLGRFELANRGTLFLDEIGEINRSTQAKLLRVLQEKRFERVGGTETIEVNVRIIAATNRDLIGEIEKGNFREDLYYRLNVVSFVIPPLRERREDIRPLINYFVNKFNQKNNKKIEGISPEAMELLCEYNWAGNVREIEHCIERAVVLAEGDMIHIEHLPYNMRSSLFISMAPHEKSIHMDGSLRTAENTLQKNLIIRTLRATRFNRGKTAQILKIHRNTLRRKMKEFRITPKSEK